MPRTRIEILNSLAADAEAMRCTRPDEMPEADTSACFGPFGTHADLFDDDTCVVEWPNLAILLDELANAAKPQRYIVLHHTVVGGWVPTWSTEDNLGNTSPLVFDDIKDARLSLYDDYTMHVENAIEAGEEPDTWDGFASDYEIVPYDPAIHDRQWTLATGNKQHA